MRVINVENDFEPESGEIVLISSNHPVYPEGTEFQVGVFGPMRYEDGRVSESLFMCSFCSVEKFNGHRMYGNFTAPSMEDLRKIFNFTFTKKY